MQSKATTVQKYLSELPPDRRAALQVVREVILKNLDKGYEEGMSYGMIGYYVPHRLYPAGYHCDPKVPLPFAGLASQKNHMSVYLTSVYGDGEAGDMWFCDAWAKTGKKLDMGKSCIRFKKTEDLALDLIGQAIKRMPVKTFIAFYEKAILTMNKQTAARAASKKNGAGSAVKKSAAGAASRSTAASKSAAKRATGKDKRVAKPAKPATGAKSARTRA